jgi:parallel beta-helix repeat protein
MFPPQGISIGAEVGVSAKRSNTIIIAAHDSRDRLRADYVCTGTNDQETINQAISTIASQGGTILFLEGTYILTGSINLVSNITLVGQGRGSIFKLADNLTGEFNIIYGSEVSGIIVSNLKIDGSNLSLDTYIVGIYLYKVTNSKVNSCWFEGGDTQRITGITLSYSNNNIIEGNIFYNNGSCINLENSVRNIIANNVILNSGSAISIFNSDKNIVIGNVSRYSPDSIYIQSSKNNTVVGNVSLNYSTGINLLDSESNTIVGNVCREGIDGFDVHTSSNNIIEANVIEENSNGIFLDENANRNTIIANKLQYNVIGIRLARTCSHNIITSNSLLDNETGILLESTCSFNLISNNIVRFNTDYGIRIASSSCENNVVHGNDLYQNATDFSDEGSGTIYHNNRTTSGWIM